MFGFGKEPGDCSENSFHRGEILEAKLEDNQLQKKKGGVLVVGGTPHDFRDCGNSWNGTSV